MSGDVLKRFVLAAVGLGFGIAASSCQTSSNLVSMMQDANSPANTRAVNEIAREKPAEQAADANAEEPGTGESSHDPVAIERPSTPEDGYQLASMQVSSAAPAGAVRDTIAVERPAVMPSPPLAAAGETRLVRTTAYSHKQADSIPYGTLSASGENLRFGMVRSAAADWSKFPLGTRFRITGLPYEFIVDDYGSALTGTETIDLYKPTLGGISKWGCRTVPIQIIEWGCYQRSLDILSTRTHVRHADHVREMYREIKKKGYQPTNSRA